MARSHPRTSIAGRMPSAAKTWQKSSEGAYSSFELSSAPHFEAVWYALSQCMVEHAVRERGCSERDRGRHLLRLPMSTAGRPTTERPAYGGQEIPADPVHADGGRSACRARPFDIGAPGVLRPEDGGARREDVLQPPARRPANPPRTGDVHQCNL